MDCNFVMSGPIPLTLPPRKLPSARKGRHRIRDEGGADAEHSCRRGRRPLAGDLPDAPGTHRLDTGDAAGVHRFLPDVDLRLGRRLEVHPSPPAGPALRGRHLVHPAVALHRPLPLDARQVHRDGGAELVGRRPGGLVLLGGPLPAGGGRHRLVPDPGALRAAIGDGSAAADPDRAVHADGQALEELLPARGALDRLRDAALLVPAGRHDLHLHSVPDRVGGAGGPGRHGGAPLRRAGPVPVPAPPDPGQLRLHPGSHRQLQEARDQADRPDGPGRAVRDVLRGDVPLSRAGGCDHALDRAADRRALPPGDRFHPHGGDVRMDRHPRHDLVPVRAVRHASAPGFHLPPADAPGGASGTRAARGGAGELLAPADPGLQGGDRLAARKVARDPGVSRPSLPARPGGGPELRHDPGRVEAGHRPAAEEPERHHGVQGDRQRHPAAAEGGGESMTRRLMGARVLAAVVAAIAVLSTACGLESSERKPRTTLFIGVDTSGSFQRSGSYNDAMTFLAYYIYGHLHELGGLDRPRELFVGSIGGEKPNEPKAFHPIQDFSDKSVQEIEKDLRTWFVSSDALTDFNPFFKQVSRIVKERNLVLAPITLTVVTDGVPDFSVPRAKAGSLAVYKKLDLTPLEYLSRRMSVRLAYVSPQVGKNWRELVPRQRVRLWTVDAEIMKGWKDQVDPAGPAEDQE